MAVNHKTNTANCQESTSEKPYVNMRQEADTPEKCYKNTDRISQFENKYRAVVPDNDKNKLLFCHISVSKELFINFH